MTGGEPQAVEAEADAVRARLAEQGWSVSRSIVLAVLVARGELERRGRPATAGCDRCAARDEAAAVAAERLRWASSDVMGPDGVTIVAHAIPAEAMADVLADLARAGGG